MQKLLEYLLVCKDGSGLVSLMTQFKGERFCAIHNKRMRSFVLLKLPYKLSEKTKV